MQKPIAAASKIMFRYLRCLQYQFCDVDNLTLFLSQPLYDCSITVRKSPHQRQTQAIQAWALATQINASVESLKFSWMMYSALCEQLSCFWLVSCTDIPIQYFTNSCNNQPLNCCKPLPRWWWWHYFYTGRRRGFKCLSARETFVDSQIRLHMMLIEVHAHIDGAVSVRLWWWRAIVWSPSEYKK